MATPEPLLARARALQLHGVVSHWAECAQAPWIAPLIEWEETERARRSLERRLRCAHIGRFKPLADFDWRWPEQCDQTAIAELMTLAFLDTATNAILVGPSGLGKTTIAQNIAHQAVLRGHTVLFTTAGQLLGELAALDRKARAVERVDAGIALAVCLDDVFEFDISHRLIPIWSDNSLVLPISHRPKRDRFILAGFIWGNGSYR